MAPHEGKSQQPLDQPQEPEQSSYLNSSSPEMDSLRNADLRVAHAETCGSNPSPEEGIWNEVLPLD